LIVQYKWIFIAIAGMVFLVVGYVFDIYPLHNQLAELQQTEIMLSEKLKAMKVLPPASSLKPNHQISDIHALAAFIQSNGLNISKIRQDNKALHMNFAGDYKEFSALMNGLRAKPDAISFKNISCKWDKEYLQIGMDILLLAKPEFSTQKTFENQENPFCTNANISSWFNQSDENELLSFPLSEINIKGFLQSGKKRAALLLLPNKMLVMVEPGSLLGREKAEVLAVFKNDILLRLQTGKELRMEKT
jgi:hypothetical protein